MLGEEGEIPHPPPAGEGQVELSKILFMFII